MGLMEFDAQSIKVPCKSHQVVTKITGLSLNTARDSKAPQANQRRDGSQWDGSRYFDAVCFDPRLNQSPA